ncbi:DUF4350 domain-containing protein [Oceanobacillus limi]|nr:DUF4350 domain-containing protein [Oceanobacillus limi]
MITSKKTVVWLILLLLIFMLLSYFLVSKQPEEYPSYVSNSPSPTGTKALYTYLEEKADSLDRWSHPPNLLAKQNEGQLLVMVEPFFVPERDEMDAYTSFMEAGNTVLLLTYNPDGMFGMKTDPIMKEADGGSVIRDSNGNEYDATLNSSVRIREEPDDAVLLKDSEGIIALRKSIGEGSLIVANAPNWLTNEFILDEDHLQLFFNLVQGDWNTILFDEYIHGTGHAPTITTLYPKWLLVIGLQALLLTTFWLWYQGKRFGPIITPRESVVRFGNERIRALAAWYKRGSNYRDSFAIQADYVKVLLQEKWAIPYRKDWTEVTDLLKQKSVHVSEKDINSITKLLGSESITKQEYVHCSKKLDQLRREVEEG